MSGPPIVKPGVVLHNKYTVERLIGRGGMGDVYLAHNSFMDRKVALKLLPLKRSADPAFRDLMRREAAAGSRVKHKNLVEILDGGVTEENEVYLVMEYLGTHVTLRQLLNRNPGVPLEVDQALRLGIQIADAIDACHAIDIWHRDLKPENVVVLDGGLVKVIDFGLARIRSNAIRSTDKSGQKLVTPMYAAPEQNWGRKVTSAADIWAVGCILFEMLTGKQVWANVTGSFPSAQQAMMAMEFRDPSRLAEERPDLPRSLTSLVDRCLTREPPTARPRMREVARGLAAELAEIKRLGGGRAVPTAISGVPAPPSVPASSALPLSYDSRLSPAISQLPGEPTARGSQLPRSALPQNALPRNAFSQSAAPHVPTSPDSWSAGTAIEAQTVPIGAMGAPSMPARVDLHLTPSARPTALPGFEPASVPVFAGAAAEPPAPAPAPASMNAEVPPQSTAPLSLGGYLAYDENVAAKNPVVPPRFVVPAPNPRTLHSVSPPIDWEGGLAAMPRAPAPVAATEAMPASEGSRHRAQPTPVTARPQPATLLDVSRAPAPPGYPTPAQAHASWAGAAQGAPESSPQDVSGSLAASSTDPRARRSSQATSLALGLTAGGVVIVVGTLLVVALAGRHKAGAQPASSTEASLHEAAEPAETSPHSAPLSTTSSAVPIPSSAATTRDSEPSASAAVSGSLPHAPSGPDHHGGGR